MHRCEGYFILVSSIAATTCDLDVLNETISAHSQNLANTKKNRGVIFNQRFMVFGHFPAGCNIAMSTWRWRLHQTVIFTKTIHFIKQSNTLCTLNPPVGPWGGLGGVMACPGGPLCGPRGGSWAETYSSA